MNYGNLPRVKQCRRDSHDGYFCNSSLQKCKIFCMTINILWGILMNWYNFIGVKTPKTIITKQRN